MLALHVKTRATKHGEELAWELLDNPPYLVKREKNVFLAPPRSARAYVNGIPVAGIQVVRPGDLVCVMEAPHDDIVSYRLVAEGGTSELGEGRPCAFTGRPIRGTAVRCGCGRVVGTEVAREIGACPACGCRFAVDDARPEDPGEELL